MTISQFKEELQDIRLDIQCSRYDAFSNMNSMHYHDCFEIYYQVAGDRNLLVNGKFFHISRGELVWIPKFVLHQSLQGNQTSGVRTVLYFSEKYMRNLFGEEADALLTRFTGAFQFIRLKETQHEKALSLLGEIREAVEGRQMLYAKFVFGQLVLLLDRWTQNSDPDLLEPARMSPTYERIVSVMDYLKTNFSQQIRLEEVAGIFYVTPSYLSRTFKACTGISFIDYVNHLKIEKGKELLLGPQSITQIGLELGFESVTHFERVFKKITGSAPREWRKKQAQR